MDNMVMKWSGVNSPGELELSSGIWVTKAGARNFPKGFIYDPERTNHWEWGAVIKGGFIMESDGGTCKVQEGYSYAISPDHAVVASPVGEGEPFVVWVEFTGPFAEKAARLCGAGMNGITVNKYSPGQVKSLLKIAQLLHEHPPGYELMVHSHMWGFLAYSTSPSIFPAIKLSAEIEKVVRFLEVNSIEREFSLDRLARISGLSIETFRKKFQQEVGESPFKYLLKCKLKQAKELLSDPNYSIKQIAIEVGMEDPYYFSRVFKKYEGLSPSDFRRRFYPEIFM